MARAPRVTDWPQKIESRYWYDKGMGPDAATITEARVVAELARKVHEYGGQFAAWPKIRYEENEQFPTDVMVIAEGWAIPR